MLTDRGVPVGLQAAGPPLAGAGRVAVQSTRTDASADSEAIPGPGSGRQSALGQPRPRESGKGSKPGAGRDEEIEWIEGEGGGPPPAKRPRVERPGAGPPPGRGNPVPGPMQLVRETTDCNGHSVVLESSVDLPMTSAPHAPVDGVAADSRSDSISSDEDEDEDEDKDPVVEVSTCPTPRRQRLEQGRRWLLCLKALDTIHEQGLSMLRSLPLHQAEAIVARLRAVLEGSRLGAPGSGGMGGCGGGD